MSKTKNKEKEKKENKNMLNAIMGAAGAIGNLFSGGSGGAGNDQKILGEMKAENERNRMLNHQMQMLQNEANRISQQAAAMSNIAKSGHDSRMTVANNMK